MKVIEFSPDGEAIADAKAEDRVREFLESKDQDYICISTENCVYAARTLVYEGYFDAEEVQFLFRGEAIKIEYNGRLKRWPEGFCHHAEDWLSRLLTPRPSPPAAVIGRPKC